MCNLHQACIFLAEIHWLIQNISNVPLFLANIFLIIYETHYTYTKFLIYLQQKIERELEELRSKARATVEERSAISLVLADDVVSDVIRRSRVSISDIVWENRKLGAGAFGEVQLATLNGTPVAVKKLHRSKLDEANLKAFRAEFELQLSLRHPNVVQIVVPSITPLNLLTL